MIRSRDLVVFVGVLLFLFSAIAVTLLVKSSDTHVSGENSLSLSTSDATSTTYTAYKTEDTVNREDTILRLRSLLSQHEIVDVPEPESTATVGDASNNEQKNISEEPAPSAIVRCGGIDDSKTYIDMWPQNNVAISVVNGMRLVFQTTQHTIASETTASSSASSTIVTATTTLLETQAYPVVFGNTTCIGSEAIGVTKDGHLLLNQQETQYEQLGPNDLIGYARDGFPIYGVYDGQTDSCGGYYHAQGYRYSISTKRDFILGCYSSTPSSFKGL